MRVLALALAVQGAAFAGTIGNGSSLGNFSHVEVGTITNGSMGTCLAAAFCSVGSYTFATPFVANPTCMVGNVSSTLGAAAAVPDVYSVSTTSVTVYVYAIGVLTSLSMTMTVVCMGN